MVEFWYEFASTYSYLAAMRAEEVAAGYGVKLLWRPFLLGPIFADLGWTTSPFNLQPAKGAYMWRDLERTCADLGIAFCKPDPFPQNGLLAARIAMALPNNAACATFSKSVYALQFAHSGSISDETELRRILDRSGFASEAILAKAQTQTVKSALRTQTENARRAGIFGAPTWRTADGELFWGNDRLEDALEWSKRVRD